ncbi:MAG TPA: succinylglutamate desuccinylase/aspartoacylase family protein [Candidatus Methylomirabilis sp.]|nr:succinylglutamate desuccinylase/aspartoacylase family protein [Candidatus Methylomirabilis sp.]
MSANPERGTKLFQYLDVPGAATERNYVNNPLFGPPRPRTATIPHMTVNGAKDGPTLCVMAGMHACEYPSIDAAIQTYRNTDPRTLAGRLIIVPVVNLPAFWTRTPYLNPHDMMDISATYHLEGGSISFLIGRLLMEQVFAKADYIVDLHGGDVMEDVVPHAGFTKIGDKEIDEKSEMLARAYGTRYVFERLEKGAFEKSGIRKPRTLAEAGREGRLEPELTAVHLRGIANIMKSLKMIEGKPEIPADQVVLHGRYEIFCRTAGLFYPTVKMGDPVKRGDLLGEIRDLEGKILEQIVAPRDSVVLLMMTNPVKHPDDLMFKMWLY